MANPTTYGTAHLYGVSGTIANVTVLSADFSQKNLIEDTTENESGQVIERRYDDLQDEGTITVKIRTAYTIPTAGATLVYETITYEITEVGKKQVNKGFRTVELKVKKSEHISYP
jgi:hypothetical protein